MASNEPDSTNWLTIAGQAAQVQRVPSTLPWPTSANKLFTSLNETHQLVPINSLALAMGSTMDTMDDYEDDGLVENGQIIVISPEINPLLVIFFYSIIVCVSLIGNSVVCKIAFSECFRSKGPGGAGVLGGPTGHNHSTHTSRRRKAPKTTTDRLIGSLALSDLIMTIFNIPFNIARILLPHWPFGSFLCYGVPFIQTACVYVSTFTMTAIALHRWRTVSATRANQSMYSTRALISIVWLLALLLALPTVAFNTLKRANVNGDIVIRCRVTYPELGINMSLFLTVEIFFTQYLIPLFITGALYIRIARVVSRQGRLISTVNDVNERKRRRALDAKRRRILMLALVVIVFAICWLPLNLYHLTTDLGLSSHRLSVFLIVSRL